MIKWTVDDFDSIRADTDTEQTFLPKPFVFEGMMDSKSVKVYLPGQTYTPFSDGFALSNIHLVMCVHLCEQFGGYPTTKWGIRIIPKDAKCPFGGRCHGAHLMWNGKPIRKSIDMRSELISELTKPEKAR